MLTYVNQDAQNGRESFSRLFKRFWKASWVFSKVKEFNLWTSILLRNRRSFREEIRDFLKLELEQGSFKPKQNALWSWRVFTGIFTEDG